MTVLRLVVIFCLLGSSQCGFKKWIKDTNFENANNWNAGRAPCGNDVVNIADDSPVIYIQMNTTLKTLILPENSEIIFGKWVTLGFTDQPDSSCRSYSGDVEFNVNNPRKWIDPANWCSTDTEQGSCQQKPLLDSEKIPCSTDNVVFPRNHLFTVDLGQNLNFRINKLKFSGTSFSTRSFQRYLASPDGRRIFPPPSGSSRSTVTIARRPSSCADRTGCASGNDYGQIFSQLCAIITNRCERAMCRNAIQPTGSCCRMCGAVFNATIAPASGFRFNDYKNLFQGFINNSQGSRNVSLIASKVHGGYIQMVLTDTTGEASIRVAASIRDDIDTDQRNGGHKYRIESYQLTTSGNGIPTTTISSTIASTTATSASQRTSHTPVSISGSTGVSGGPPASQSPLGQKGTKGMSGGSVAGLVIGLMLLIAIVAVIAFFLYRKRIGRPIDTKEYLDNLNPRTLLTKGASVFRSSSRRQPDSELRTADPGFPNPLYGTTEQSMGAAMPPMELMPIEEQPTFDVSDSGFNNPLYGTIGQNEPQFQDPSSTNIPDSSTI